MHGTGEFRQLNVGMLRAKADGIREVTRIGTAAHGKGLFVFAGHIVVGGDQRLDGRAVRCNVERHAGRYILQRGSGATHLGHHFGQVLRGGGSRVAAVKALAQAAILHLDGAANDGQRVKHIVAGGNAQGAAVRGGVQGVQHLQISGLGRGADLAFQQAGNDQPNGVYGALRHGGVAAFAPAADDGGAVLTSFKGHALGLFQGAFRQADGAGCAVGHSVVGNAAHKINDYTVFQHGADQLAAKTAFFAVAYRELGVRGKAESGLLKVGGKIVYVVHVGFLIGTQQGSHGVLEGNAVVFQVFQGIQAQNAGAFVVGHAAAQQPAIPHAHGVGVSIPAVALGHNVGVGDGSQILLAVCNGAGLRPADVTFGVVGVQAKLCGNFQGFVQRSLGAFAKRCARLRRALNARHSHKAGNIT